MNQIYIFFKKNNYTRSTYILCLSKFVDFCKPRRDAISSALVHKLEYAYIIGNICLFQCM